MIPFSLPLRQVGCPTYCIHIKWPHKKAGTKEGLPKKNSKARQASVEEHHPSDSLDSNSEGTYRSHPELSIISGNGPVAGEAVIRD